MKVLQKSSGKDFVILNLSDTHMNDYEWDENHPHRPILEYTIRELVARYHPDLITITGDIAYPEHFCSYEKTAQLLDSFNVPWAIVWGNHDQQDGAEPVLKAAKRLKQHPLCLFEDGDPTLGNGNYTLEIHEGNRPITALFMVDSHNIIDYVKENGEKSWAYDKLWPEQLTWLREQSATLKQSGYIDGLMMLHTPPYCYRGAAAQAFPGGRGGDSEVYGQQHEFIASYPHEDNVLTTLKEGGLITHVLAGHDHCNNFIVNYNGVVLAFACKTGAGAYWQSAMNGGTIITIGENGIKTVHQQRIDVSHLIKGKTICEFVFDWNQ